MSMVLSSMNLYIVGGPDKMHVLDVDVRLSFV